MLDTNIWIYIMNRSSERVMAELARHEREEVCLSVISYAELRYGMEKSARPRENLERLKKMLEGVEILPFDARAAAEYARIRADLEERGRSIGGNDVLIAAQANSLDLTLVTHNVREFLRVEGLEVADWAA